MRCGSSGWGVPAGQRGWSTWAAAKAVVSLGGLAAVQAAASGYSYVGGPPWDQSSGMYGCCTALQLSQLLCGLWWHHQALIPQGRTLACQALNVWYAMSPGVCADCACILGPQGVQGVTQLSSLAPHCGQCWSSLGWQLCAGGQPLTTLQTCAVKQGG